MPPRTSFDFTDTLWLSEFGAAWKEAIEKATHFDGLRQNYKKTTVICANSKCTTTPDQYHFVQVCSRCRSNVYCSYECQKTDWNDGHREACRGNDLVRTPCNSRSIPAQQLYLTIIP
ncbi:hypothetical protein BT96DRAFT_139998 [Gymnopus androsaceus JB14]|uniref:MYND-type domain-containing protein n=1 Tax=Gymnopus androsaceus JB14 TaxID=1447944 RepID=A0A6A4HFA5_9AGAR|nr:hypothetical protein BT96DRAFT_139998 [Gymnopus androsaceus JB14]